MHFLGPDWMDPAWLLANYDSQFLLIALLIVFVECGLLFPILPGDSLLFAVGLFIAEGSIDINLGTACLLLTLAAFLGNIVGYEIGRAIGTPLYRRKGRFINAKNFDQTHEFFERYGAKARAGPIRPHRSDVYHRRRGCSAKWIVAISSCGARRRHALGNRDHADRLFPWPTIPRAPRSP